MYRAVPLLVVVAGLLLPSVAYAAPCGEFRTEAETGYSLAEGMLSLPGGGTHSGTEAQLRDVYGLFGPVDDMVRTRFEDECGAPYQVGYWLISLKNSIDCLLSVPLSISGSEVFVVGSPRHGREGVIYAALRRP